MREVGMEKGVRVRLLESYPGDEEGRGVEIRVRKRMAMRMCMSEEEGGRENLCGMSMECL